MCKEVWFWMQRLKAHLDNTTYNFFFNVLKVKIHILNFLSHLAIQLITSKKVIFNIFWEVKISNFSKHKITIY